MPERTIKLLSSQDKTPKWRVIKPIPPLMMPKKILTESMDNNRSKPILKNSKPSNSINETKDSYKILLLIRELALSQEREEALNESVLKEKEENLKITLDFNRTRQELNELQKKEQSLCHQLAESCKIISHYEKEISDLRERRPLAEKSSIGVGTDIINHEISKLITAKSNDKIPNQADLQHFLNLCRQNEMSISVVADTSEKLDTESIITESLISSSDQKIQNEKHKVNLISECIQTEIPKTTDTVGVQTEEQSFSETQNNFKEIKVDTTPEYLKFIMNAYAERDTHSKKKEKFDSFKDRIKAFQKNPCFKTSPKNSMCTCAKKSDSSKSATESSQSLFLLQDETSMLVPLADLLAELESSYRESDTIQIDPDVIDRIDYSDGKDDLSNLIEILNF